MAMGEVPDCVVVVGTGCDIEVDVEVELVVVRTELEVLLDVLDGGRDVEVVGGVRG